MGYLLILCATALFYVAVGSFVAFAQSRTGAFFIAGGVAFGCGAYCAAILLTNGVTDLVVLVLASVIAGVLSGLLVAVLSALHDARVLDVIGLALLLLCATIARSWYVPGAESGSWSALTNGSFGLGGFENPSLLGFDFGDERAGAVVASLLVCIASALLVTRADRGVWGISLRAIRDDRLQGALDGYRILSRQLALGMFAGAGLGAGGACYALTYRFVDPSLLGIETAIGVCLIPLIFPFGGPVMRAIVGGVVFALLPELLRGLNVISPYETYARNLIFFLLALLLNLAVSERSQRAGSKRPGVVR